MANPRHFDKPYYSGADPSGAYNNPAQAQPVHLSIHFAPASTFDSARQDHLLLPPERYTHSYPQNTEDKEHRHPIGNSFLSSCSRQHQSLPENKSKSIISSPVVKNRMEIWLLFSRNNLLINFQCSVYHTVQTECFRGGFLNRADIPFNLQSSQDRIC